METPTHPSTPSPGVPPPANGSASTEAAGKLFDRITRNLPFPKLWEHVGDREPHDFRCDDRCGVITVMAGPDADMHAFMHPGDSDCHFGPPAIRARTHAGGGNSERVRRALMLLALAIKADDRR